MSVVLEVERCTRCNCARPLSPSGRKRSNPITNLATRSQIDAAEIGYSAAGVQQERSRVPQRGVYASCEVTRGSHPPAPTSAVAKRHDE